ncbi:MAG: WD40/YVTN/BNR-like repeat-containing protein, partial [Vicinamibacterales bacterium]
MDRRGRRFRLTSAGRMAGVVVIIASLTLAACSGAETGDPTVTVTAPAAVETATTVPSPTATATATLEPTATATLEPTATATATVTATLEPTATPTTAPTATPTVEPTTAPLPGGGAEVRILGKAIHEIVAGDDTGQVLYAITAVGVSRSRDGGRTWTASGDTQEGRIVVALNDPDVLYAGDFGVCAAGSEGVMMTRSVDGGVTWQEFAGGLGIRPLLVEAGQSSTVIGTDCRLRISTNGGQNFSAFQ